MSSVLVFVRGLKTREKFLLYCGQTDKKFKEQNDLTWNDLTMEQSDRIPQKNGWSMLWRILRFDCANVIFAD